jgi:hypothetical protein
VSAYDFSRMHLGPVVFFAQGGDGGPIRISSSGDLSTDYEKMLNLLPVEPTLLGYIPQSSLPVAGVHEHSLRQHFASYHIRRGWHSPGEELINYIKQTSTPPTLARKRGSARESSLSTVETALPRIVTASQLSSIARASRNTVMRLARLERIPHLRIGKHVRFILSDVFDREQFDLHELLGYDDEV